MKQIICVISFLLSATMWAQTGTIEGVLTDKESDNEPLPFANVVVKGTTKGATTDLDGKYIIENVPVGTYTMEFSFVGYESTELADVKVEADKFTNVSIELGASAAALDEVLITVQTSREREEALLLERKEAIVIKQSIGAEELSRKGVSNAEGAVTKLSGISKQQGVKNVFVRGLGDRYNFTTLNDLPLPSEDPEYKNIALDFFASGLIETVDVSKVFSTGLYGDAAGANINIDLKGLSGRGEFNVSVSTGFNSQTLGEDFKRMSGSGFFGFTDNGVPVNTLDNYSFDNNINPENTDVLPNIGFSMSGGKRFDIGDDYLNVYGLVSFDNDYRFLDGTVRNTNSTGAIYLNQDYDKFQYNVSQIGLLDLDYHFGGNNIELIGMYLHNNAQTLEEYDGINNPEQVGDEVFIRRQQVNDNNLFVSQLLGNFELSENLDLNTKFSYNLLRGSEPDRRNFQYLFRNGFYSPNIDSAGNNQRYFSDLTENDLNGIASIRWNFSNDEDLINYLDFGANYRFTDHSFEATIFNHNFGTRVETDINNPDAIFNQQSLNNNIFRLETGRGTIANPNAFDPFTYTGEKTIYAGFLNYSRNIIENFVVNAGLRFENIQQTTVFNTNIANSDINGPSDIEENLFLPSLGLKYNLNEEQIIRLSGSKTYILPRFKETAPFRYDNPGGTATQGNPDLILSNVYNVDLGYEFFPTQGELLAITGFFKTISDPISRTEIPSGGNTLTYLNVGQNATVVGVELEMRKKLWALEHGEDPEGNTKTSEFFLGLNASYLDSKVDLEDPLAQFTENSSQLEGAAPFLINADLNYNTYLGNSRWNNALVINYFTERIFSIGTRGFQNITEIGVPTLDFVSGIQLSPHSELKFKGQNLLNPELRLERTGGIDTAPIGLNVFRRGVNLSLSYSYNF